MKKTLKVLLSIALAVQLLPTANLKISATSRYFDVTKVSNPSSTGKTDIDGLVDGGDRANSYAWSMAQTEDYVWIGSNRSLLTIQVITAFQGVGIPTDKIPGLIDLLSNGSIPSDNETLYNQRPVIVRYNKKTGAMEKVYQSPVAFTMPNGTVLGEDFGFRVAKTYKGSVYFGSLGAGSGQHRVLRFDDSMKMGDQPEIVYSLPFQGDQTSIRAMEIFNDELYIGTITGNNEVEILKSSDPKLGNWEVVADTGSFDGLVKAGNTAIAGGGVFDLVSYNGYLYANIVTSDTPTPSNGIQYSGWGLYKGKADENGNWNWIPVVSSVEGAKYPLGMGVNINAVSTPCVYDGKLYIGTFVEPVHAMTQLFTEGSVDALYNSMQSTTQLYSFDENDNAEMIVGNPNPILGENSKSGLKAGYIDEVRPNTTLYTWRMEVHNGQMYVGTWDAYALYRLVAGLKMFNILDAKENGMKSKMRSVSDSGKTTEELNNMESAWGDVIADVEELTTQEQATPMMMSTENEETDAVTFDSSDAVLKSKDIDRIIKALNELLTLVPTEENVAKAKELVAGAKAVINELSKYEKWLPESVVDAMNKLMGLLDMLEMLLNNFDFNKFFEINRVLTAEQERGDTGADLLVFTEDGAKVEVVTNNGFNNEYNYGFRTLLSTGDKLMVGTANPFYGTQLWTVDDGTRPSVETTPSEEIIPAEKLTPAEKKKSPNTGDTTDISEVLMLAAGASILGAFALYQKRKRVKE